MYFLYSRNALEEERARTAHLTTSFEAEQTNYDQLVQEYELERNRHASAREREAQAIEVRTTTLITGSRIIMKIDINVEVIIMTLTSGSDSYVHT